MKKIIALSLSSIILLSTLAACNNNNKNSSDTNGSKVSEDENSNVESNANKLTLAIQRNNFVTDYDNNYLTKKIEEDLGVDLTIELLSTDTADARTNISLMLAGGSDLPDAFVTGNVLTPEAILDYGSKGSFLDLTEWINDKEKSPHIAQIPEEDKTNMLNDMTSADGKIYGLATYEPETWNLTPYRFFMNETWLKAVGKEIPTTTDEYYEALKAFADEDPNGNGVNDEIGAYGYTSGGYGQNITMALMNAFVFYNGGAVNGGLALSEDGKTVMAPFTTDEWKQGLEFIKKLYDEGLLASSVFTDDDNQFRATLNAETPIVGSVTSGSLSAWTDAKTNKNFGEMTLIKPLKGPNGVAYTPYTDYVSSMSYFVTAKGKNNNPELAYKLGEYFYDTDMSMIARFGEKGVDWTDDQAKIGDATNDLIYNGVYEKASSGQLTNIWAENSTQFWHNINPRYASLETQNTSVRMVSPYDPEDPTQLNFFCYEHYLSARPEYVLPLLKYTAEESSKVVDPLTEIPEYVQKSLAEFVTGSRPLSDWDRYVADLDSMGLQTLIETAQVAYDRVAE